MKFLVTSLVALSAVNGASVADEPRMNQSEFVRAARCLTLANLPALQSDKPDTSALAARYNAQAAVKPADVKRRANGEARRILIYAAQADTPQEVEKLKARRDRLCGPFLAAQSAAQN